MTIPEIQERLSQIEESGTVKMSSGPFRVKVSWHDGLANRLLLWLSEQLPDDATVGDVEDILQAAIWWHTFFVSQPKERDEALQEAL